MRKQTLLPSVQNVVAGATAILNCPVGMTYEEISFLYSGVTLAQITGIRVKINGKTVQDWISGTQLDEINKFYGYRDATTAGILTIYFVKNYLLSLDQRRITALGTADVSTLSVELDIDAGAAAPVLTAYAMQSRPAPLGIFTKVKQFPRTFATSGLQEIDSIPLAGARIGAIHLGKSDITDVKVDVDSVNVIDMPKTVNHEMLFYAGRVPQTASYTHVDFLNDNDLLQALITKGVQDFRIKPTLNTLGSVQVIVEYLDQFNGI